MTHFMFGFIHQFWICRMWISDWKLCLVICRYAMCNIGSIILISYFLFLISIRRRYNHEPVKNCRNNCDNLPP